MHATGQRINLAATASTMSIPPDVKQIKGPLEPVHNKLLIAGQTYRNQPVLAIAAIVCPDRQN